MQQPRTAHAFAPAAEPRSEARLRYRGFWIRVAAYIVDAIILGIAAAIIERVLPPTIGALVALVVYWVYFAGMESSAVQATLGKMTCGIAVADARGRRISFARASGRTFAKILSSLTLGIGYLMVAWTRRKQGLHDFIAGTVVIDADQAHGATPE